MDNNNEQKPLTWFEGINLFELNEDDYDYDELIALSESVPKYHSKPKWLLIPEIKRKFKWDEYESQDKDLKHRRFTVTLQSTQVLKSFKKCLQLNEFNKKDLLLVYKQVAQKLLQNPNLQDSEVLDMYTVIRKRTDEVYDRRLRERRRVK